MKVTVKFPQTGFFLDNYRLLVNSPTFLAAEKFAEGRQQA